MRSAPKCQFFPPIGGIEGGLSQAGRGAEGGQCGGEDAHQHLNNSFPSFFFHFRKFLIVNA